MSHQANNIMAGTQVVSLVEVRGPHGSRVAILTNDDGSYVRVGGSDMTCCFEWRDLTDNLKAAGSTNYSKDQHD